MLDALELASPSGSIRKLFQFTVQNPRLHDHNRWDSVLNMTLIIIKPWGERRAQQSSDS